MISGYRTSLLLILLLLVCTLACTPSLAATDTSAGDGNVITVVMDNNYPPFSFRDAKGNLVGISVDMWRLWEKQTGKTVVITGLAWDDAIHRMEAGEFDVIDTFFYSEERSKIYDFTPSYADVDVVIFFNADVQGISGLDSLDGFVVGMHKGDSSIADVKKRGVTVREYDSYASVVKAAKDGEIVVFILDKPQRCLNYLLQPGDTGPVPVPFPDNVRSPSPCGKEGKYGTSLRDKPGICPGSPRVSTMPLTVPGTALLL